MNQGVSPVEIQARNLGVEGAGDGLREWLRSVRDWSGWQETINHIETGVLERDFKERTAAVSPSRI